MAGKERTGASVTPPESLRELERLHTPITMAGIHTRPFVGVSRPRSWGHFLVFVGKYRQKLINLIEVDFGNTPTKGLAW